MGWADVLDSDLGDFRRRRAVDISSLHLWLHTATGSSIEIKPSNTVGTRGAICTQATEPRTRCNMTGRVVTPVLSCFENIKHIWISNQFSTQMWLHNLSKYFVVEDKNWSIYYIIDTLHHRDRTEDLIKVCWENAGFDSIWIIVSAMNIMFMISCWVLIWIWILQYHPDFEVRVYYIILTSDLNYTACHTVKSLI